MQTSHEFFLPCLPLQPTTNLLGLTWVRDPMLTLLRSPNGFQGPEPWGGQALLGSETIRGAKHKQGGCGVAHMPTLTYPTALMEPPVAWAELSMVIRFPSALPQLALIGISWMHSTRALG